MLLVLDIRTARGRGKIPEKLSSLSSSLALASSESPSYSSRSFTGLNVEKTEELLPDVDDIVVLDRFQTAEDLWSLESELNLFPSRMIHFHLRLVS